MNILDKIFPTLVDDVVCISLRRRSERWNAFCSRADGAGLGYIRRFEAIDGAELELPSNLLSHKGAYGCLLSHKAVFAAALLRRHSRILVMEDDCVFTPEITFIEKYLDATRESFSWIHLDNTRLSRAAAISQCDSYISVGKLLNTHAYVIDRKLMQLYVNHLERRPLSRACLHADRLILHLCRTFALKMCIPLSSMAFQDKALPSDVEWGEPLA